ncbi:Uncharacterized protein GBIM_05606 [Gryllus bimaculatus]|nr:Uncharacterized protein GBIM_05606 [Gryllus bimaculatus]
MRTNDRCDRMQRRAREPAKNYLTNSSDQLPKLAQSILPSSLLRSLPPGSNPLPSRRRRLTKRPRKQPGRAGMSFRTGKGTREGQGGGCGLRCAAQRCARIQPPPPPSPSKEKGTQFTTITVLAINHTVIDNQVVQNNRSPSALPAMPSSQAVAALLLLLATTAQMPMFGADLITGEHIYQQQVTAWQLEAAGPKTKWSVCPRYVNLGDACYYDEECDTITTFCRDRRVCACKERFREAESRCVATVGARCSSDYDCGSLENSMCSEDKECTCREGYVRHSSYNHCLPVVYVYQGRCEEDTQCQESFGDFAFCDDFACRCMDGRHHADGKCWNSKGLGEACHNTTECSYAQDERHKVHCVEGECQCREAWQENDGVCEGHTLLVCSEAHIPLDSLGHDANNDETSIHDGFKTLTTDVLEEDQNTITELEQKNTFIMVSPKEGTMFVNDCKPCYRLEKAGINAGSCVRQRNNGASLVFECVARLQRKRRRCRCAAGALWLPPEAAHPPVALRDGPQLPVRSQARTSGMY